MSLDLNYPSFGDFYFAFNVNVGVEEDVVENLKAYSETELEKCYSSSEMTGSWQPLLLLLHLIWFLNKRLEVLQARNRVHSTQP